ncbi:Homeodomain [Zea mays]|uniref:Homeodomain n=1 Tax=Zea mays TaxID=4577 RepID=A0A1D6HPJ5_MAIZE|nr:Homeodomain [Zea mays]
MSRPIERLFFTEEKDTIRGKQEHHEESSTMHAPYSNFFDLGPPWNTGSLKGPKGLPSEVKFGIMDRAPEFSLDLRLDSFTDNNSVAALRSDKLFLGSTSSTSRKLTEKLGMYSYKRQSAPWSEEELDFLWIGVRRYGVNNWNAMLRDSRLRFSISRMPEDLAKQWDKEQKKLVGPAQAVGYLGRASCSGCSKSASVGAQAQTDLSLGEYYLRSGRAPERGHQHHLPTSLGVGGFPGASSSYGRSGGRRRRASKSYYYENKSAWFQEPPSDRVPQQPGGRMGPEMWPSIMVVPPPTADPPRDDDVKPHVLLPDATLKRAIRRSADWGSFSRRLFLSGDLNGGAAGAPVPSDTGASSEETVSDS